MSVQQNIARKQKLFDDLKSHCMVQRIIPQGEKLVILYPYDVEGIEGLRVDNTASGIENAIERCEQAWKISLRDFW